MRRKTPEEFIEYSLVRLASILESRFREALRPLGLTPHQFSVLAVVQSSPNLNPAEIAKQVMLTPQSLGAIVDQMEDIGLLLRLGERKRGVRTCIQVSDSGMRQLRAASTVVRKLDEETVAYLGEDYGVLFELVQRLTAHFRPQEEKVFSGAKKLSRVKRTW